MSGTSITCPPQFREHQGIRDGKNARVRGKGEGGHVEHWLVRMTSMHTTSQPLGVSAQDLYKTGPINIDLEP